MKTILTARLALGVLTGVAAAAYAFDAKTLAQARSQGGA